MEHEQMDPRNEEQPEYVESGESVQAHAAEPPHAPEHTHHSAIPPPMFAQFIEWIRQAAQVALAVQAPPPPPREQDNLDRNYERI